MLGKLKPAATGAANESGQWTWKHVALGAAGVLLIGISSYGIYTFLLKSDESGSSGAKSRSKASLSTVSDKTETSTSKVNSLRENGYWNVKLVTDFRVEKECEELECTVVFLQRSFIILRI